jgi:hypothetical protein
LKKLDGRKAMPMRRPLATRANCDEGDADNQEGVSKVANVSDLEWLILTEKPKPSTKYAKVHKPKA